MKPIKPCTRNDLKKGQNYIERNWRPREEIAKELAAQKQKMLDKANGIIKPAHKPHKHNPLERQPQKDICDFRLEEKHGIYFVGGKKGKVRFSR